MPPDKKKPKKTTAATPPKPCPVCGKPATDKAAPFCSERCREIDLGRWLSGSYRIPARDDDVEDD